MAILVGVSGGSGSGKTTFARELAAALGSKKCDVITQDSYYFDQSAKFDHDGGRVNFDHPDSLDSTLLQEHLEQLATDQTVLIPKYDFKAHKRLDSYRAAGGKAVVILDGILIFHWLPVRSKLSERIFIETPEQIRFERRLRRDIEERGRTPEGVSEQFASQVKPMHDLFVEPSKIFATMIVDGRDSFSESIAQICSRLIDPYLQNKLIELNSAAQL